MECVQRTTNTQTIITERLRKERGGGRFEVRDGLVCRRGMPSGNGGHPRTRPIRQVGYVSTADYVSRWTISPLKTSRRGRFFWLGAVWNTTPGQAKTQLLDNKQPVNHKGETFSEPN